MLNIVVPMAGLGSRFAKAGYTTPKPLIPIHGVPMIEVVLRNLRPACPHRFILICQREHMRAYGFEAALLERFPQVSFLPIDGLTEGAACTVLKASELINNDQPLMIANSDQYVDVAIDDYLGDMDRRQLDGLIMTMVADDPKWSFVDYDAKGHISRVVEKEVISNEATVGIYNFRRGRDFVEGAQDMIRRELRVNGEYYVAPVYNMLIERGAGIGFYNIGAVDRGMYGLGIPADLESFLKNPLSHRAASSA